MSMMRKLRPSASRQWMHCGLSAHAPLDRPEQDGDAAREGTCAAWVAELVRNGDATCAEDMLGKTHNNGWAVDEEMVRHINAYLAVLPIMGKSEVFMQTEHLEGTADDIGWIKGHLAITDLKYGYGVVEAVNNWQLLSYLYLHTAGQHMNDWPDNVTLRIYQPRAIHDQGPLRSWHLTRAEYEPLLQRIGLRIKALVEGENEAHVGPQCTHCMHAVGCQALTQSVYKIADLTTSTRVYHTPSPEQLGDELAMLERMSALLKARRDAVEEEVIHRIAGGRFVPDWTIKSRYGKKRFTVDDASIAMLTGIDPAETKTCTPAELLRRGANPEVVNAITDTPRIGHKLVPFEGEDKVAAQFRAAKLT